MKRRLILLVLVMLLCFTAAAEEVKLTTALPQETLDAFLAEYGDYGPPAFEVTEDEKADIYAMPIAEVAGKAQELQVILLSPETVIWRAGGEDAPAVKALTVDGKLYGYPLDEENALVIDPACPDVGWAMLLCQFVMP